MATVPGIRQDILNADLARRWQRQAAGRRYGCDALLILSDWLEEAAREWRLRGLDGAASQAGRIADALRDAAPSCLRGAS